MPSESDISILDTVITYLETRDVPVNELTPYPGNAKRGDVPRIQESLRRHGQYRALVVQKLDGLLIILAGNHTHQALVAEGYATARCELIACTPDEAARINLVDNRSAELGSYDDEALVALLENLGGDFDGTGYEQEDLDKLLAAYAEDGNENPFDADLDDVPDTAPALTKPGDLYVLGTHFVICGDSTDPSTVARLMQGDLADIMWTDPPYGVDYVGKTKDALTIDNDGAAGLEELLAGAFKQATAVLKPGSPVYVAHADTARITFETAMLDAGWRVRQNLVWVKDHFALGRADYHYKHEPILYGFTAGGDGRLGRGGDRWYGDNAQDTVFAIPKPQRNGEHPTMKPIELIGRMLANSCPKHGLVYEPFGGSGSTMIAANAAGMHARLIELDPKYVDVICRRWQLLTDQLPELHPVKGKPRPVDFS